MSVPHTGRLTAEIAGLRCVFDGDTWNTPNAVMTDLLNSVTASVPKQHYDIHGLARVVIVRALENSGFSGEFRFVDWQGDAWPDELPPGAID